MVAYVNLAQIHQDTEQYMDTAWRRRYERDNLKFRTSRLDITTVLPD